MATTEPLLTSHRLGVLGGGQLGRMMAWAAHRLGVELVVLDDLGRASPGGQAAHDAIKGSFRDPASIRKLAATCNCLTVEIEHIDTATLEELQTGGMEVQPKPKTLRLIQDKFVQKQHLQGVGVPLTEFVAIGSMADVRQCGLKWGYPLMLKSRLGAYDGRGNAKVSTAEGIKAAFEKLGGDKGLLLYAEQWAPFECELAVMVARGKGGEIKSHPVVETVQKDNVCHTVIAPAQVSTEILKRASAVAEQAVAALPGRGIFGVELFLLSDGSVLLNEIAPRPHNSGHYTIEACVTDQFEQHLRAVLGLPLGDTSMKVGASIMVNTLGVAAGDEGVRAALRPHRAALSIPGASVHWYGKAGCRPGRKMGHITVVAQSMAEARRRVAQLQSDEAELAKQAVASVSDVAVVCDESS